MNPENYLNVAIIAESDLQPVLAAKVTAEFFSNDDDREVFEFILEKWGEYGKVPGPSLVKDNFPNYKLVRGSEPYEVYLDEVRRRRRFSIAYEMLAEATEQLEDDQVDAALDTVSAGLIRVLTEVSELRDTNLIDTWERRLESYEEWKRFGHVLKGVPSGFPSLDDWTRGWQAQQLICLVGSPKAGKSWTLLKMALAAHDYGKTPLFIGFEMSNEEQEARHDSMVSGISFTRLTRGQTTREEDERLMRSLKRRRSADPFILASDPDGATVSGIAAKIEQYKPDIVFIDGVYMMEDEAGESPGSPQALTNITRSLKRLARRREIPIVYTTQVLNWKINRKRGLDENAIGYSSSHLQDPDVVIGVEHTNDEDPNDPIKKLKVLLARSVPKMEVLIHWDWETTAVQELKFAPDGGGFGTQSEEEESHGRRKRREKRKKSKRVVRRKGS